MKQQTLDEFIEGTGHDLPITDSERYVCYSIDDLYPGWQAKAHCAGVGHEYYFGNDDQQPTMSIKQVRNAAKLCDVCPVFSECLRHALTMREEYGVWAGTSGRARRRMFSILDSGDATITELVEAVSNARRGEQPPSHLRPRRSQPPAHAGDVRIGNR